jgi:hypothetical protein
MVVSITTLILQNPSLQYKSKNEAEITEPHQFTIHAAQFIILADGNG